MKTGFPPRSITLISELPLSSLGLNRGDQLIISELKPGQTQAPTPTPTTSAPVPAPEQSSKPKAALPKSASPAQPKPAPKTTVPARTPKPAATQTTSTSKPSTTMSSSASNAPAPAVRSVSMSTEEPEQVTTPSGILVHRVVPDDNSCLFSSIGIVFEQDMGAASKLRQGEERQLPLTRR